MKTLIIPILMLCTLPVFGQTKGQVSDRFNQQQQSSHFLFQWNQSETSGEEVKEAVEFAEATFEKLGQLIGNERMPGGRLIITLRGEGVDPETYRKRIPHVDNQGRMHLYRFESGGYLGAMAHEMVHAIRIHTLPRWERFFEEGLASALAYYLYPETIAFARYGYPLEVVAGHWLVSGKAIPMEMMRAQHNRLNLKCSFQTYVLREDFFNYLKDTYGIEMLLTYAYSDDVGLVEGYLNYWGKSFSQLVTEWETDLQKRYEAYDGAAALAKEYLKETPARYSNVCEAGVDY